jgi:fatty acid desaturase
MERLAWVVYALGVIAASLVGFFSPWWFLGFAPLSAGLIYAALDLIPEEVPHGATPPSTFL